MNGTRYVRHSRPERELSHAEVTEAKEDNAELRGETTKEQSRRLLTRERTLQAKRRAVGKTKRSGRRSFHVQELQTVEEDGLGKGRTSEDGVEEDETPTCDRLREVEIILRTKVKGTNNSRRDGRPHRRMIKVKGPSVRGVISVVWTLVVREISYAIKLYSCAAVRYARFRSNRRFKPGD